MKYHVLTALAVIFLLYSCSNKDSDNITPPVVAIDFDISQDSVKVNPYGYTPLSALVSFTTEKIGSTVLIVKGKHGAFTDIVHRFNDAGTFHSIPVIGMYADYANTVLLRVVNSNGDTLAKSTVIINTDSLPADLPTSIAAQSFNESEVEPGLTLVSSLSTTGIPNRPSIPYFIDDYGDIRWVLDYSSYPELATMSYDDGIARLRNGNFYFGDIKTDKIYEVNLLGQVLNTWSMPGYGFHHEVYEKPDGNFLVSVNKEGSLNTEGIATEEDYVIEINRQSGNIDKEWDLKESLDEHRIALSANSVDWMHVNAVAYDSTDNTIVVSGRTQGVVKLDYDNNVKWILSPHAGWGKNRRGEDLNQFLLTPLDALGNPITDTAVVNGWTTTPDFEWNWYQHSNIFMPNGNIMIFDNGTVRAPYPTDGGSSIFNSAIGKYSRAVEYKIDETNMTVQQVWSYGKERDQAGYSAIISSVQYLPEKNHILFGPGFNVLNNGGSGGKIVEVDYATKEVVAEISINTANKFAFHRAKKMSAYPSNM
jgi:arylsulfate sulfotransferase